MKYKFCSLLIILFLYSNHNAFAAEPYYSPLDISQASNLQISSDYANFPTGNVTFSDVPFYIKADGNNFFASQNVACPSCPTKLSLDKLNIPQPKNIWVLVNSSDSFITYENTNFAYIEITFTDTTKYSYDFIVGKNLREWLENNNYGPTVNWVNDTNSTQAWVGSRPNGEQPIVTDLLKIVIPDEFSSKSISKIEIIDDSLNKVHVGNPIEPGIIIKGLTVETLVPSPTSLTVTTSYDAFNKQVPWDRDLSLTVNVTNGLGHAVEGASVSASLSDSTMGSLVNAVQNSINNGDANFIYKPSQKEGPVTIHFESDGATVDYSFTQYRPPVVIVPGLGASFNSKKFFKDDTDQSSWDWSVTAEDGWDKVISSLENAGFVKGTDYAISFYDWRKSLDPHDYADNKVEAVVKNLRPTIDSLLAGKPNGRKVNILAHSFGGLVARSLVQQNMDGGKVNQLITMGTPSLGATPAYYIWNGGEMAPSGDAMFRTMMGGILAVYKYHNGLPELAAIHNSFPSIQQLLPDYENYFWRGILGIGSGDLTYVNSLLIDGLNQGDFLDKYNSKNFAFLSIYGTGQKTMRNIKAKSEVGIEIWPDGIPEKKQEYVDGDDTVLPESAQMMFNDNFEVKSSHGDLPDNSVNKIFSMLHLPILSNTNKTTPKNTLFVFILSPAESVILNENNTVISTAGSWTDADTSFSYARDLADGIYTIKVTGTGSGNYTAYITYAGPTSWNELEITNSTKSNKVDQIPVFVSSDETNGGISKLVNTSMTWQLGMINLQKRQVWVDFMIKLPDSFATDQLHLDKVQFNKKWVQVVDSKLDKKGKKLRITLNGRDVARSINWREDDQQVSMIVVGENTSLLSTLKLRVPWGLYRRYID